MVQQFAAVFNGKARRLGCFSPTVVIYSDASSWEMAATHGDDWLVRLFQEEDSIQLKCYAGIRRRIQMGTPVAGSFSHLLNRQCSNRSILEPGGNLGHWL